MFWFVETQKKMMAIQSNRYFVSGNEEPNHVLVMLTKNKPFSSVMVEEGMALKMHDPKMIKTFFKTNILFLSPNSIHNTNNLPEFDQKQPYHTSSFVRLNLPVIVLICSFFLFNQWLTTAGLFLFRHQIKRLEFHVETYRDREKWRCFIVLILTPN